jgi:hypothetical protein
MNTFFSPGQQLKKKLLPGFPGFAACLIGVFTCLAFCNSVHAQSRKDSTWKVLSPLPGSNVKSGELFIVVQLDERITLKGSSLKVFLDKEPVSYDARVEDNRITLIYMERMKPGKHSISIFAKDEYNRKIRPIQWGFMVGETTPVKHDSSWYKADIFGRLSVDARKEFLTGPGKSLRQEPSNTTNFNFNGGLKYRRLQIPVKVFGTSDQNRNFQSRNFVQAGVKYGIAEAYFGDLNPTYDRLIISGQRISGAMASVKLGRYQLHAVHGYLQRGIEGSVVKYSPGFELPPLNPRPDSTYIVPGVYRRSVSAVKFQMGDPVRGSSLALIVMKSSDDTTSIQNGNRPKQNLVGGIDNSWVGKGYRLRVNLGFAISLVTDDISKGAISRKDIFDQYGIKSDYDPSDFKKLIIINTTTTPLYVQKKSSNAFYFNGSYKIANNFFSTEYRSIGGAYASFANPFLRNDIRSIMLSDRIYFLKKKLTATVRVQRHYNNLTNEIITKVVTRMFNANILMAISPKLPTLSFTYNIQDRLSFANKITNIGNVNDRVNTYSGSIFYNFTLFKMKHYVNVSYMRSDRRDYVYTPNGNVTENYLFSFSQTMRKPVELNLQLQRMDITTTERLLLQRLTVISAQLKYSLKKYFTDISFSGGSNFIAAGVYSSASTRPVASIKAHYKKIKNTVMELELGTSPYYDRNFPMNNYGEAYVLARYFYNFN